METETKNLAALVRLALEQQTCTPVCYEEITNALNALQTASGTLPFCTHEPAVIVSGLESALNVLAALLYIVINGIICTNNSNAKALVNHANKLHKKLSCRLHEYCNAPVIEYNTCSVKNLLKTLSNINNTLKQNTGLNSLYQVLQPHLEKVITTKTLSFNRWVWWSRFVALYSSPVTGAGSFTDFLVMLNFNTPAFINYLSVNLLTQIRSATTIPAKSEWVMEQLVRFKNINALGVGYVAAEDSVKHTIINLLEPSLTFFTTRHEDSMPVQSPPSKLQTALSVPQLALFIRLMVDTKILNTTSQTELLRNFAAFVSTPKSASVSPGSLKTNYYTPDTATKNKVKEYLLQMVRLANTY